jgi:hypothetical protein
MAAPPPNTFADVTFTLDSTDYSCSVTSLRLIPTPKINEVSTLCGNKASVGQERWNMEIGGLQDYHQATSLSMFLIANSGTIADFNVVWVASEDDTYEATATGEARLVAVEFGGAADEVATWTVSLPVEGTPTFDNYNVSS